MLPYIAVKPERLVVLPLTQALLLQKVNGKNRCVPTVSAAKRERETF
jgi:hypothetical protein